MAKLKKLVLALALTAGFSNFMIAAETNQKVSANTQTVYPGGKGWTPGAAQYGVEIVKDVFIPMEDGIKLEAKIAYPTDLRTGKRITTKVPVIIEHTPYEGTGEQERFPYRYFAEHGYIVALVRPRGSSKSEGELQQFSSRDAKDTKNIVDWVSKMQGSNGKVGLFGCSYPGALALNGAAAVGKNSPVKAVLAGCIGLGAQYRQAWTNNGIPTVLSGVYPGRAASGGMGGSEAAGRYFTEFGENLFAGKAEAYDGEYWHDRIPIDLTKKIVENDIPVLMWGGWQDLNETGAIRAYTAFQNLLNNRPLNAPMIEGQKVSPRYQLIIGNWVHGAGMDIGVYLEWFDTWLKGENTGLLDTQTPLHLYEAGTERWVNLKEYPAVNEYTTWYLGSNGTLSLDRKKTKSGENKINYTGQESKNGKLVFESEASKDGFTLAGPLALQVYAKSNNKNMILLARLYDVAPDGKVTEITKGSMVASLSQLDNEATWKDKNGKITWPWPKLDKDVYLTPDKVQRFDIAMEPIQYGLQVGHKLRLEFTTQSPKTICDNGKPIGFSAEPCGLTAPQQKTVPGGEYTIFFGGKTPTALNLPQTKLNEFKTAKSGRTATAWSENTRNFEPEGVHTLPLEW